ncbi:hypothetical protein BOX15_Mlig013820g2 [Macrostomum lignano]|uniref:TNF_2 domain-containing protein n=1 Tax=Macrostomum lignano TaxID=282301 RepID=A0A267E1Z7_9PLAT|nr:hypothetical protein BOX15_Mlig013820g2 [Macrostomum lignano]
MPEPDNNDCTKAYLKVEQGQGRLRKKSSRVFCRRIHVAWVILPFLFLLALQAAVFYWLYRLDSKPHITVVIDLNGTRNCDGKANQLACKRNSLYVCSNAPIGPLRCHDDAFKQSGGAKGSDNCKGNDFRVAKNGLGVVIPRDGLYRVYVRVAFYDKIAHHTSMHVRIDPPQLTECLGNHDCLADREQAAHAWLTCQAHQPAVAGGARDFTSCAIDGIRRFSAGETVGLQVAIGHREIVGHRKATYMYIHKL